ncbi:serine/threonine-protein kinase SMG1 isoform X2 [Dermacentor albipictus]|uniref:serine/threonine-protein kinase SMG1 isoform X1 n=1 Tax=Dermacentor albipictus TaxID=60249 RepID=UPI0031FCCEF7
MSGSRWFVSKSKESRRERTRTSHNHGDERRDDYVSSHHHRRGSERASERSRASHHGAAASSPDRKDNPRPSAAKNSEGGGGHGQLVFRRQDRVKVKQRTPDGSPRRDEHKPPSSAPSKSRGRGDSKKPSGDDDLWGALGHVYNEVPAWALREARERLTPAWVAKHQSYLRRVLEEALKRTRLPHDARNELAACLSAYGTLLGERAKEFVDWLLNVYDTSIPDESRICLLKALLEVLKGNPQVAAEVLQTMMGRAQSMLESAEDCELLLSACSLSLWAAEQDPEAFAASYFHDAVDILVGWHIDAPSESLARRTGEALEQLGPFWAADPNFCATLLGQFVEDLEAYAEDLANRKFKMTYRQPRPAFLCEDPNECLDRMASLLRVYGTVVHSLGDQAVQVVTWELLSENLHGMANCVLQATEFAPRNSLLVSANQTVVLLCNLTGQCPSSLVDLLHLQAQLVLSEAHTLSLLRLLGSLVQHLGAQIPLPLVSLAFESRWRRSPRARVQAQLLSVQHAMLKLKSVAIVEEAYRCLVQSLDATGMAATALAPLCSLSQVANARHSIIGMWALKPAFFDLLLEYLTPISDGWHGSPSTQYAMLYLLHSHSQRHGHFISSSTLLIHGDDLGVPRSVYLSRILTLLASVLTSTTVPDDVRRLCQHWSLQLVECLQLHMPHLAHSTEFLGLVDATIDCGYTNDTEATLRACQILQRVVDTVSTLLPRDILQRCYNLCVVKAGSAIPSERSKFIALMTLLPVDLLTSEALLSSPELQEQAVQRTAILSAPGTTLTVQGFRTVMSALLLPPPGGGNIDACELRLERLAPAGLASGRHAGALWCWALWECAQTCVQQKLRTALGKPQETFTSVEGALKALLAEPSPTGIPSLKRAQLLLDFLEQLDKCMYNAYEGSAGSLPAAPKAVRTFFRTNRATCLEWLARVRPRAVRLALRAGRPAEALRHTGALAATAPQGLGAVVRDTATSLVQLRCPEAIWGLYAWGKEILGQRLPWLRAAAAHAAGRYESAAEEYAAILKDDAQASKETRPFLLNQILDCHMKLADWDEALKWAEDSHHTPVNGCINKLSSRTSSIAQHIRSLLSTDPVESPACPRDTWDAEQQLLLAQHRATMPGCCRDINASEESAAALLQLCAIQWPPQVDPALLALVRRVPPVIGEPLSPAQHDCSAISEALTWSHAEPIEGFLLAGARLARKQHNLRLAERWLLREAGGDEEGSTLTTLADEGAPLAVLREAAKLLHARGELAEGARIMARVAWTHATGLEDSELVARSLLTLAKWLQAEPPTVEPLLGDGLRNGRVDGLAAAFSCSYSLSGQQRNCSAPPPQLQPLDGLLSSSEVSMGSLLRHSLSLCPTLPKAWATYAGWCYRWGRKVIDAPSDGKLNISTKDNDLAYLLPDSLTDEEKSAAKRILMRVQLCNVLRAFPESDCHTDMARVAWSDLRQELEAVCPRLDPRTLDSLLKSRAVVLGRAFHYYRSAASAYFKYLQLQQQQDEDTNVTATLRLLRLVVKHASELRGELEEGLTDTPTAPWRGIIPQLFSRLNHPEAYVRRSIQKLLSRLARDYPHLIVFPAVVGALPEPPGGIGGTSALFGGATATPSSDATEDEGTTSALMRESYVALVDTLAADDAQTITQVRLLVGELRRITLLWDELWVGALNVHSGEAHRRIRTLEEEVGRVRANTGLSAAQKDTLIRDKHALFLCPTLRLLEQLQSVVTSREPETPHEVWFSETLGPLISETLATLRNPHDPWRPQASWAALRRLHLRLQRRPHEEGPQLLMERVSPALAALKNSRVPMPGCSGNVRIAAVQSSIAVLPTKTKPKKLSFQGSDGQRYTFLFKGMEDLHLDERIMQLLSICNSLLARGATGASAPRARHYAVTPLGSRSGLIQWLDGVTPLFALYKRWQQREAASVLRPSELFYGKLTPLLKEQGITNLDNRREWPVSVLVSTLQALMAETPKDLVARELWCAAASAPHWWRVTCAFNRSTAVMSTVGYVIGLGDRHLDNMLLDLRTGEVVHIDYNVCFEKGKNLRVPEKVPFRMTPNIEAALGVTGVEGQFRLACEQVLKVLRRGRETLLTLLEAFVYDPLVDWDSNTGVCSPASRLERDMASALLAIRIRETAQPWAHNRRLLADALDKTAGLLRDWQQAQGCVHAAEQSLGEACAQQTILEEALASEGKDHPLFSLPARYREWALVQGARDSALRALLEKLEECRRWSALQTAAMSALSSGTPPDRWRQVLTAEPALESVGSLAPLVEFLQSSGQLQLLQQCEQSEGELLALVQQLRQSLQTALELLGTYSAIVVQGPPHGWHQPSHRLQHWQHWLDGLHQDFTLAKCQEVISEFHHHYGVGTEVTFAQAALALHYELQSAVSDCNSHILSVMKRKQAEGSDYLPDAQAALMALAQDPSQQPAVVAALLGALCPCAQNLLVMETAAAASGERLADLQFWGSDWFLQDLHVQAAVAHEMGQALMQLDPPAETVQLCVVAESIYKVFAALLDVMVHFQTIILPEALKRSMETSVLSLVSSMHEPPLGGQGVAEYIEELVRELHQNMTNGVQYEPTPALEDIKVAFDDLMKTDDTGLTPGKMLVQGFHGLFAKTATELSNFYATLSGIDLNWKSVDVVWSAYSLCPPHLDTLDAYLKDIMFLQCLQCMHQIFSPQLLSGMAEEHAFLPVKHCIASIYRVQMLGLPSFALSSCLCATLALSQAGDPNQLQMDPPASRTLESLSAGWAASGEALSAVASLEAAQRHRDLLRRLDQAEGVLRVRLQRCQLRFASHHWLHEEALPNPGGQTLPARATLLAEMRKAVQASASLAATLSEAKEAHLSLVGAVEQRLKWAGGANPALADTRNTFAQLLDQWTDAVQLVNDLSVEVCEASEALLLREALRTRTTEALAWDSGLLGLLNRCQESCMLAENAAPLAPAEQQLLQLQGSAPLPSEASVEWLRSLLDKVALGACREQLEQAKTSRDTCREALQSQVSTLRADVLGKHHELLSELRSLLKSLARQEDTTVQEYLATYRQFSERASELVRTLLAPDTTPSESAQEALSELIAMVPRVYDGLTELANAQDGLDQPKNATVNKSVEQTPDRKVTKDPRTGKALQERNSYAVGVWRRVKMKLDGRDPDSSKRSSVAEQVDYIISEATRLENLALLYEGWTPWV